MEQAERLLPGSSFGAAAAAYAEHRPDHAPAAVRWAPASGGEFTVAMVTGVLRVRRL